VARAQTAQAPGQRATALTEDQRARWDTTLPLARVTPQPIAPPSRPLTHGKPLTRGQLVTAYAPTGAPSCNGQSNCPTQLGRTPGISAAPATGFVCAAQLPVGNPSEGSYGLPLVDQGQTALSPVTPRSPPASPALAGDLALNEATLREPLPARGILTVGIPPTVEPLSPPPTPEAVQQLLTAAGLSRKRTPRQVQLACAAGSSRPVGESIMASLLSRGAAQLRYKGWHGAWVQVTMAVLAHNAAPVRRIRRGRLTTRAQKFRRLLHLRPSNPLKNQEGIN